MVPAFDQPSTTTAIARLARSATAAAGDPTGALALAPEAADIARLAAAGPAPMRWRWELLAALGRADLTVARTLEPHLDALAILAEAGAPPPEEGSRWGVFAAEGPGEPLRAARSPGGWRLTGDKNWCSLADTLSHALVSAWSSEHGRTLFRLRLDQTGVVIGDQPWVSRGLSAVRTVPLRLDQVIAEPVGQEDWYYSRPGFALGGVGVAAIWWGGALALRDRLHAWAWKRGDDRLALLHLGRAETALHAARCTLLALAAEADRGTGSDRGAEADRGTGSDRGTPADLGAASLRVRCLVHDAAETVLRSCAHAMGPAPLTQDEEHARRVADLEIYLRQHHAEGDLAALGGELLDDELPGGRVPDAPDAPGGLGAPLGASR